MMTAWLLTIRCKLREIRENVKKLKPRMLSAGKIIFRVFRLNPATVY